MTQGLDHKRYCNNLFTLSRITCSGGSQLPYCEDTQTTHMRRNVGLPLADLSDPSRKPLFPIYPQTSPQMTAAPAGSLINLTRHTLARTMGLRNFQVFDTEKSCKITEYWLF